MSFTQLLRGCTNSKSLFNGRAVHAQLITFGSENPDVFTNNHLLAVSMVLEDGFAPNARLVFDGILVPNSVTWASLISCYFHCEEYQEGLNMFVLALREGVIVNEFFSGSVLGASAAIKSLQLGRQIHGLIVKSRLAMDQFVVTGLINFYAKCGRLDLTHQAFDEADAPELHAWTAMIGGCVQLGSGREAIELFCKLLSSGLKPSERTFSSVLGAFADVKELRVGKQIHCRIVKLGFNSFSFVCNALLDFYSKSDLFEESLKLFQEMKEHDVVSWNTLIAGCVSSGRYEEAMRFLREMLLEGFELSLYTYSSILSICGDLPAIEWGKQTHCRSSGVKPNDITFLGVLSACGHSFSGEPDKVVWRCLLSGCKANRDFILGKYAAEKILDINPDDTSAHIVLSNIYAELQMWDETTKIRKLIKEKALKKETGHSWIELQNKTYTFSACHIMSLQESYLQHILTGLTAQLLDSSYVPDLMFSLNFEKYKRYLSTQIHPPTANR
ncbi:hypothetical protein HAX54_020240 [Datura stramonium]|uniref:Pentatricopeptide repeat-containing protein n=1 Tax=Datura stramonium TaxID=4076 RepID=A0ABS8UT13_DATST|nr:hypothetical protein [Datura stramonium]